MKPLGILLIILTIVLPVFAQDENKVEATQEILTINQLAHFSIDSSINPATLAYLRNGLKNSTVQNSQAILISINTPGGLITTTKDIITLLAGQNRPWFVWVTPEGASATSAGAIIASGATLLYMSPGTNIGAATPVQGNSDIESSDHRNKAINDLVALVEALSTTHGRNAKYFADMVDKSSSYGDQEAQKNGIIDGTAADYATLWPLINGRTITHQGKKMTLQITQPVVVPVEMEWGEKLLNIFAHPSLTYVLLLLGAALIYLEVQAPGGFIAGSIGVILLIISGIGMQLLPLNLGALALIALSFILFVLEMFITSYGLLSIAGLSSLVIGSLFLFQTQDSFLTVSWQIIASATGGIGFFLLLIGWFLIKDIRRTKHSSVYNMAGQRALVVANMGQDDTGNYNYQVKIGGELWRAQSDMKFEIGMSSWIKSCDNKSLTVHIVHKL